MCTTGSTEQNLMLCCREPQIIIVGARSCEWQARGPELGEAVESRGGGRSCHEVLTFRMHNKPLSRARAATTLGLWTSKGLRGCSPDACYTNKTQPARREKSAEAGDPLWNDWNGGGKKRTEGRLHILYFSFWQAGREAFTAH